jgi:hypothetical protein
MHYSHIGNSITTTELHAGAAMESYGQPAREVRWEDLSQSSFRRSLIKQKLSD